MKRNVLLLCGIFAPIVYVAAVILGGALRPGYSHLSEPISELTAAGAPNKGLLDIFFLVYNVLVIGFGVGLFQKAARTQRKISGMVAAVALAAAGVCGVLLQLFFPQDPGGAQAAVTTTGTFHIVFAGLAALTSMIAAGASALWFHKLPGLKGYSVYSLVTLAVMFVSGGIGAAAAGKGGFALFGVVERITIGSLIQWLFFVALRLNSAISEDAEAEVSPAYHRSAGD